MVVAFAMSEINYVVEAYFASWFGLIFCIYLWCYVHWLRYLPCFRHGDKSGYAFAKVIHDILIGVHQSKLFLNKMFSPRSNLQIVRFLL